MKKILCTIALVSWCLSAIATDEPPETGKWTLESSGSSSLSALLDAEGEIEGRMDTVRPQLVLECEPVEDRGREAFVPVEAEVIRPESVDRDQDDEPRRLVPGLCGPLRVIGAGVLLASRGRSARLFAFGARREREG